MIEYRKTAVTYQGDGNTSVFPFSFAVTDANSVRVSIYDKETDVSTELTRDYFVDMTAHVVHYPGYAPGEPVDAHAQPPKLPRGRNITIYRVTPINQLVDLGNKYPLPYIEAMADKVTAILQEHDEMLGRAVTSQKGSGITPKELIDSIFHAGEKTDAAMNAAKESAARAAESKTFAKSSEDAVRTMTEQVHMVFANSVAEIKKALGTEYVSQEQAKETRRILDDKAPIASPALTGTPTVPTASKGTSTDQIASTAFVAQAVAALNGLDSIDGLAKAIEGKIEKQGIVASSLETNGWVKFANGLIVQWGTSVTAKIGTVTFPVSYPQQCFGVQANSCQLVDTNPFKNVAIPYNISTSGFSFRVDDVSNQVQWIAIGI